MGLGSSDWALFTRLPSGIGNLLRFGVDLSKLACSYYHKKYTDDRPPTCFKLKIKNKSSVLSDVKREKNVSFAYKVSLGAMALLLGKSLIRSFITNDLVHPQRT